ncbi:MAG: AAA family ATPase [Scytolyngbya sp. HA4215-MV1]|nr:AAA family ATPase [Scytolyngbya sp. HA4215-MV1]
MDPYTTNLAHLQDELHRLDVLIKKAVQQFRASRQQNNPVEFQGLYISDDEIDRSISERHEPLNQIWADSQTNVRKLHAEIQSRVAETPSTGVILRLPYLQKVFDLSLFETDLLLLAIAPEIDLRYQRLYAYLQDDVTRKRPSIELALRLFCYSLAEQVSARAAFLPDSPLLKHHLLLLHEDPTDRPSPLLSHSLKLDDRITEFLLGSDRPDARLCTPRPFAQQIVTQQTLNDLFLPDSVQTALQHLITLDTSHTACICLLHGSAGVGKQTCAQAIARVKKRPLLVVDLPALLKAEHPFQTLLTLAFREARLYRSLIYLNGWHDLLADAAHLSAIRQIEFEIEQLKGLVFVASQTSWQPTSYRYQFIQIELPLPDERSRQHIWQRCLSQKSTDADLHLGYLASAFRFTPGQIQQAISHAETHAHLQQGTPYRLTQSDLLVGCRAESSHNLATLAQKVTPRRSWQDLVLPKDTLAQLQELCQQVRHRKRVYTDWGFDQRLSLGKGAIALFRGDSGTGKTLSAEIIARELGLDLYKIDLSLVVSKYIGETEKNLSQVFQEAQKSNAILFFDEADALFGKRADVKDAHDRYANIETNYLLQRVEEYEGIIILASNLSKNIDPAFIRRLHFSIEFPFPTEADRLQIWQRMFPPQAPRFNDIDFEFLSSKFKITGGNIKNVALTAAFRAAEEGSPIQMKHLILSMKREYQKLGRICERTEFEPYYELVR